MSGPRRSGPGPRPPRPLRSAALALVGLATLLLAGPPAAVWGGAAWLGRTPEEVLAALQREAVRTWPEGEPVWLQPLLATTRWSLGVSDDAIEAATRRPPFQVQPLPPNPATAAGGAAGVGPSAASTSPAAPASPAPPSASAAAVGRVIRVGPGRAIQRIGDAARIARDGDVVEVDPGDYVADTAVWGAGHITVRGLGPEVRLIAGGADAEGKGIWVLRHGQLTVEGLVFSGARVADRNGAGIRLESGKLIVRRCRFHGNQTGILTSDAPDAELDIDDSVFDDNGAGDGLSHDLYVGRIARLRIWGSRLERANRGHLLKSRARVSDIRYNRLVDGSGGQASYELELPNGGDATVVGNLIAQGALTSNSVLVSYGAEGYTWIVNRLTLAHNTLVNELPRGGTLLRVLADPGLPPAQVQARNNLLVGTGGYEVDGPIDAAGDRSAEWGFFERAARGNYRPLPSGCTPPRLAEPGHTGPPLREPAEPVGSRALTGAPRCPGALQPSG